ncbi:MAG: ABC transporter permease subunit [Bradymonadales bacterium]|nr:ABC transporter permease subunit [Bradymonadales bacterium]
MMRTLYITQRELKNYFTSATAYIVVTLFLLIAGGLFWLDYFQAATTELSMRSFFGQAPFFMAFFVPAVTMGLLSEERRSGTLEMLMTLPVRDVEVVLGKFFAALGLVAVVLLVTFSYPITLAGLGALEWGPVIGGYLGLLLLGATYAGVGVMVSSWTKDQIISILLSFFFCFLLFILGALANVSSGWFGDFLRFLSTSSHFENIARGVIDLRDLLYYLSVAALGITVATVTLSARRW